MTESFEREARLREFLPPCLLLLLSEAPAHGYDLIERLKPLGFAWDGHGPIYRELRALEKAGFVASTWSLRETGPGRRVYEVTPAGQESLRRSAIGVTSLQALLAEYLARFRRLDRPGSAGPTPREPAPPRPRRKPAGSPRTSRPRRVVTGSGPAKF